MNMFHRLFRRFGLTSPSSAVRAKCARHHAVELIQEGNALEDSGLLELAMLKYESAKTICPTLPSAHLNCGNLLLARAEINAAIAAYRAAIALDPYFAAAYFNLGNAHLRLDERDTAAAAYSKAIELKPDFSEASIALECTADELGPFEDSEFRLRQGLERKIALDPSCASARWSLAISQIRPIYDSAEEMHASVQHFDDALGGLEAWFTPDRCTEGSKVVGTAQPFHLAYQDWDQRALLARYGRLCCHLMSAATVPTPSKPLRTPKKSGKLRIGFASAHVHDHSVWIAITKGWIKNLDTALFDIHLFHLGPREDEETASARKMVPHFIEAPRTLIEWSQAISNADLDALIYPEIGMDALTTQLASQRLAPLQMTSWGHPNTSGLPSIDIFISATLLEPTDSARFYTEKLVCLANLGVCVEPLNPKPTNFDLASIGLSYQEPLLLCPGMPFKYGPNEDIVWVSLASELQKIGSGQLIFFQSHYKAMNQQLERRLRRCFDKNNIDFERTIRFIPKLPRDQFYGLMQHATLMLDTVGFSGFNTALQALECGLPVVAFEGNFMRGRLASALLRRMDLPEWIASSTNEFIEKALKLAREPLTNRALRKQIEARRAILFNDLEPIKTLERVLFEITT